MDEIKANISRIEERMAQSQAAWETELGRQAQGISQLELGQENLAAGQRSLAEGQRSLAESQRSLAESQKSLAEAVRKLGRAVEGIDALVVHLDKTVTQHGLAIRELRRSNTNLREASMAYRQDADQMFGQLKAAVFVLETSTNMRFERIESRLDELERRPPAA